MINSNRNSRRGFTLVELLVVMGIIAILAAVAVPAYSMAMRQARKAKCSSNLRTIGGALITFATDNNNNFPEAGNNPSYGSTDSTTGQYGWTQQLEPYLGVGSSKEDPSGNSIYQCPDRGFLPANQYYSYFIGAHAAWASNGGVFGSVSLMKIRTPSAYILAGDISNGFQVFDDDKDNYNSDPAFNGYTAAKVAQGVKTPITIHGGSVNLVFADGHVENARSFDYTTMTTVYPGPGTDANGNPYDFLYPQ